MTTALMKLTLTFYILSFVARFKPRIFLYLMTRLNAQGSKYRNRNAYYII